MYKNSRLYAVISYITWVGFIIALVKYDRNDTLVRRHLNQALCINIIETIGTLMSRFGGILGTIGTVLDVLTFILFIMGIYRAAKMSEEPLPIVGQFEIIK